MVGTPSRKTLLTAVRELVNCCELVIEDRVPGKYVVIEWPSMKSGIITDDKATIRAVEYVLTSADD